MFELRIARNLESRLATSPKGESSAVCRTDKIRTTELHLSPDVETTWL